MFFLSVKRAMRRVLKANALASLISSTLCVFSLSYLADFLTCNFHLIVDLIMLIHVQ